MTYNYSQDPEEQLPDWLKALRNEQRDEPVADEPAPEEAVVEAGEAEETSSPEIEAEVPEEAPLANETKKGDDPDWLSEIRKRHQEESTIEKKESVEEQEDTKPFSVSAARGKADEEQGALIGKLSEEFEEVQSPESSQPEDTELAPGEIPSWLEALRPAGAEAAHPAPGSVTQPIPSTEHEGPLAGLSGVLSAEPEITQIGMTKSYTGQLEISRSQQKHRETLEEMLAGQSATSEKLSHEVEAPMPWLRWLIASALLLASLLPLLGASERASLPARGALPESLAAYNLIEALPQSANIFVAFEVQPSLYGEIEVVASPVIGHLIEKEAQLIFLSTLPTGPGLADRLMRENFAVEEEYVNLGYLSGGTAALRYFASHPRETNLLPSLWNTPALQGIEELSDFALILIISSDAEDARAWIEQVGPETNNDMIAATSAQASPLLYAYVQSEPAMLLGLIGGIQGAATYEKVRNQDGAARKYWDAYSYALGATVLLILTIGLYERLAPANALRSSRREEDWS